NRCEAELCGGRRRSAPPSGIWPFLDKGSIIHLNERHQKSTNLSGKRMEAPPENGPTRPRVRRRVRDTAPNRCIANLAPSAVAKMRSGTGPNSQAMNTVAVLEKQ